MKTRTASRQAGFTLVELIVVILILGILSALALPKFINMGGDARTAKVQAIYGSVRAAAQITHAAAVVRNAVTASNTVAVDNTTISTAWGYPDSTVASGIAFASGLDVTANNSDQVTITSATPPTGAITISAVGAVTPGSCVVSYTPATSATVPPVISVTTSGC